MAYPAMVQDIVRDLRHRIAKIEGQLPERLEERQASASGPVLRHGFPAGFCLGVRRLDESLGGGLPSAGLVEIHGTSSRDCGAVTGLALALAGKKAGQAGLLIWIGTREIFREAGRPYAPGLAEQFGIRPESLILAEAAKLEDVLWIAEQAADLAAPAVIVVEAGARSRALDLTATRRLHRRALAAGHLMMLLRHAGRAVPTAAPVRLLAVSAAASPRTTLSGPLQGSIGPPAFGVSIDKSRFSSSSVFVLEWDGEIRAFKERSHVPAAKISGSLAAISADGAGVPAPLGEVVAFRGSVGSAASGDQRAGRQHPADRRARRAG